MSPNDPNLNTSPFLYRCKAAFVVISIVVWDAMPLIEADNMYKLLVHKLNKFGLPTTRRCATNENRTCACQGINILSIASVIIELTVLIVNRPGSRNVWCFL